MENAIKIRGARVHNLKNINVDIPKNKLVVITGISGSGKSSLAFDTLYAEGQRRYVESLSAYARQFLGLMEKPDVDTIEGLQPSISIDQKSVSQNPRSTIGTITEIYDYLRLLFARVGVPHCPKCGKKIGKLTLKQITDEVLKFQGKDIVILAPIIRGKKGEYKTLFSEIERQGFPRVKVDGEILRLEEAKEKKLNRYKIHSIEVVIDRLTVSSSRDDKARLVESLEMALRLGNGVVIVSNSKSDFTFSQHFACEECGIFLSEIEPRTFSFNSPYGACFSCTGLGTKFEIDPALVFPNPNLTIAEGAIRPWATASHRIGRQSYYWWILEHLADKYNFSLSAPIKELPEKIKQIVLYGDKEGNLTLRSGDWEGHTVFEGVIGNLMRRWKETDSEFTRKEIEKYMIERECAQCQGKRLKPEALAVKIDNQNIHEVVSYSIEKLKEFFVKLFKKYEARTTSESKIAFPIVKEISTRLQFLMDVGLDYLTLDRRAPTLSGGESQRIRLATQIGSGLSGVIYVLDEPSVGLHQRDQKRLIETLKNLRDLGNTVIVVEHDEQTIRLADYVIDIGPGAGDSGGKVIAVGTPQKITRSNTLTGTYLSGKRKIDIPKKYRKGNGKFLEIKGATEHNLKNIDVNIPLGTFTAITGVSGSGKSTLMIDILAHALAKKIYDSKVQVGTHKEIKGLEYIDKAINVDQSPIGRTPRSNPATYTGLFSPIRELFSKTQEARIRGYSSGRFSFNVKGGRCEACQGEGYKKIEMQFLPDVYVECEECKGSRYLREVLEIDYKGKTVAQVLNMSVEEALSFFENIPAVNDKLLTLQRVGLGYIKLGQPATTLSGGEAQRIKLAKELSKRATGRTLYILDEPTTGLHFEDIRNLLGVLHDLVDKGNTVICIEHQIDMIKNTDYIIDLGPEGGDVGGYIVAQGLPKEVSKISNSWTGQFLKEVLR